MLDEQKQRATEAIQKAKRSSADREVSAQDDEDFDLGNHIDDTLLDITQAYELNINEIVTNALRRKSNTPIETLEQFTALDAEDFASLTSPPVRLSEAPTHNTTTTTSSATHRRSIKVPEPPEFANDDKVKFAEWSTKMRMKLRAGEFDSQDETTKLHYLLSRTRNGPFMRLKMNDWYGDRHEKSRAYSNLANMSQGYNEPFADFYAKFEEKLAYVTMDDEQQMIQITEKLNGRYRSRIDDGTNYANVRAMKPSASDRDRDRDRRPRGNRNASISSQGSTASSRSTSSTSTAASSVVATLPKLTDELR
ncbi:unnamed protein product [Aureobasidium pullulans]|nr:unnamed protein product [Aureobasidium pullulans]